MKAHLERSCALIKKIVQKRDDLRSSRRKLC